MSNLNVAKTEQLVNQTFGNSRYLIGQFVAGGAYGSFHFGYDLKQGIKVAIKLEDKTIDKPQLYLEFGFYRVLGYGMKFLPKIYHFGPIMVGKGWDGLVMELLGPSLMNMCTKCGGSYTVLTTTQVALQLFNIAEYIHAQGLVYRDIKPENFLFGPPNTEKWCTVHLIDLGFCKQYRDESNRHIEYREGKPIAGTLRYLSTNNHLGRELSRRDDMEALLYMIVFLCKGELPWQGVAADSILEKYRIIGEMKMQITPEKLCAQLPAEFAQCMTHVKELPFEEPPRYRWMMGLMRSVLNQLGVTLDEQQYDWDRSHVVKPIELRQ